MDQQELRERVETFPLWNYEFDLDGVKTPAYRADRVNRHLQRRQMAFDPLVRLAGGSLSGKRVLDLGSNAGYWSLAAIEAGADFVFGIDGRQMHLDQANLVFEAKRVEPSRYHFELGNIFTYDFGEAFDVVLCLGLMYHTAKPMELFEVFSRVQASLILIDTQVNLIPGSAFRVGHEASLENPLNAVDYETVLIPSRRAVIDLARQFGYDAVSLAQRISDPTGMREYVAKERAAFLCSRDVPLDGVDRESMSQVALGLALAKKVGRRVLKRGRRLVMR